MNNLSGYSVNPATNIATLGGDTQSWAMDTLADDNTVVIHVYNGTGKADMFVLVPNSVFTGETYVYLYAKMGDTNYPGSVAGASASNGPERFSVVGTFVTPLADISVAKSDPAAVAGSTITYTITVTNSATSPTTIAGIYLNDTLDSRVSGVVYVPGAGNSSTAGSYDVGTQRWTDLNLQPGEFVTMTLIGTVSSTAGSPPNLTNTVTVDPLDAIDSDPSNNTASVDTPITQTGDLSITKTDDDDDVTPGQSLTYKIVVFNPGPSTATGAVVQDGLLGTSFVLSNWTIVSSNGATSTQADQTVNINDTVTLPPNSTLTYTLFGIVSAAAIPGTTFTNTATVVVPVGYIDPNLLNNSASHTNTVISNAVEADLAIAKTNLTSVVPGTVTQYRITVTNNGPNDVLDAIVVDNFATILTGITYTASATGGATGFTALGSGSINDTVDMPNGSTITYIVEGTIDPLATGQLQNIATVTAPTGIDDPDTANNNIVVVDTLTPIADLRIAKSLDPSNPIPGTTATYTITVTNGGPSTVSSVTLIDSVPSVLFHPIFSASNGSYDSVTGVWNFATPLADGDSATVTLTGTILPEATGTISDTATVSPPAGVTDPDLSNNTVTVINTLYVATDLGVQKSVNTASATVGSYVTFTITVTNYGPGTVNNFVLTDSSSPYLINSSYAVSAGSYNSSTGLWSGLNLTPGSSVVLQITRQIASGATGALTNTATISLTATTGVPYDTNAANNQASASLSVIATAASKRTFLTSYRGTYTYMTASAAAYVNATNAYVYA